MSRFTQRKALILLAATELMARRGYEATTIAEVAKAAGASVGSVTNFFGSKARLAFDVCESVAAGLVRGVGEALERSALDPRKAIEEAIAACLAWQVANAEQAGLLQELAAVRVGGRRAADVTLIRLSAVVAQWAMPQIEAGRLPAVDPTELFALIFGPALVIASLRAAERPEEIDPQALARHLASQVCAALWREGASAGSAGGLDGHRKVAKRAPSVHIPSSQQLLLSGV